VPPASCSKAFVDWLVCQLSWLTKESVWETTGFTRGFTLIYAEKA
jgi:hypothetical protein